MTTLEARVRALECAVYGTAFRTTDKDLFNDTVSRLDLTTLEASLRAEMAVLKSNASHGRTATLLSARSPTSRGKRRPPADRRASAPGE
jgi:hypothetical protein